ncbi:MAG: TSUP family transporter [Bacillota bacterium]|uniref:sulfite exporter TauE/SafE family protein n=1 Tax=Desulfurispora thermophila TaxID=265470 RepID=UPI0003823B40|nr:sulfite exporter TauE/SafE family protein [Desulfurispora thermophila]
MLLTALLGLSAGLLASFINNAISIMLVPLLLSLQFSPAAAVALACTYHFTHTATGHITAQVKPPAMRRVALVTGIVALPAIWAGQHLLTILSQMSHGTVAFLVLYSAGIMIFIASNMRQFLFYCRNGYYQDNPLPPAGLFWPFLSLAAPGAVGLQYITVGRVALVALILGVLTGFSGMGPGLLGLAAGMYLLGLPANLSRNTENIAGILIYGSVLLLTIAQGSLNNLPALLTLLISSALGRQIGCFWSEKHPLHHRQAAEICFTTITSGTILLTYLPGIAVKLPDHLPVYAALACTPLLLLGSGLLSAQKNQAKVSPPPVTGQTVTGSTSLIDP